MIKGKSIYVNTNLIDSRYPENADHFDLLSKENLLLIY